MYDREFSTTGQEREPWPRAHHFRTVGLFRCRKRYVAWGGEVRGDGNVTVEKDPGPLFNGFERFLTYGPRSVHNVRSHICDERTEA